MHCLYRYIQLYYIGVYLNICVAVHIDGMCILIVILCAFVLAIYTFSFGHTVYFSVYKLLYM